MIKVNFYGPDGAPLSRRETISLYATADLEVPPMPGYVPDSALFTREFEPKESFFRLKNLEKSWSFAFGGK